MSARGSTASWKLAPDVAEKTQGLVVSGFGRLRFGRALFLRFGPGVSGGGWLAALEAVAPITPAVPPAGGAAGDRATALALSGAGMRQMGLDETTLASFSRPFREGMLQEDRLRRLGDRRGDKWRPTVISGGPLWSVNMPMRRSAAGLRGGFDVSDGTAAEAHVTTALSVDAVLLLYADREEDAAVWSAQVEAALDAVDVAVVRARSLFVDAQHPDHGNISREHFGFADGLSQPEPFDLGGSVTLGGVAVTQPKPVQGVPLGDFLIGYRNGYGEPSPGPVLQKPDASDTRPDQAGLVPHPIAEGFLNFGLNGSYMVVRELKQDVAAFWQSMEANAERIRAQDPVHAAHVTADWIAERAVGRNKDGHLLCPKGALSPVNGAPNNDYLFWKGDRYGHGCPAGSHVRRANPRDALAPDDASRTDLLAAVNRHRILRRGRKYGDPIADPRQDDGKERGLLFICLNTDIARQFEFVQQTWLLNDSFAMLYKEQDPLVGAPGPLTIREQPLRRIVHVETYVQLVGGDYFFLPSLPALRYLALL